MAVAQHSSTVELHAGRVKLANVMVVIKWTTCALLRSWSSPPHDKLERERYRLTYKAFLAPPQRCSFRQLLQISVAKT